MHEENESIVWGKEKSNSFLFAKYVILYLNIPKESIKKLVKLIRLPKGMINILKFPAILSIFPVTGS